MARSKGQRLARQRRRARDKVVECDYCGDNAVLVTGADVYPTRPDLADRFIWECQPCDARVGCHLGTTKALGRLANEELRANKMQAHATFDPIWRNGHMQRKDAYRWLAKELEIDGSDCHIGMMDVDMCERVIEIANEFHRSLKDA